MRHAHVARLLAVAVAVAVASALGRSASAQIVFEPPTTLSLSHLTQGVLTADVNADGHLDLISQPRFEIVFNPPHVSVLLGAGDGSFGAPIVTTLGTTNSGRGRTAFIDGDGFPDLALAYTTTSNNGITLLFGNGDGTFTVGPSQVFPLGLGSGGLLEVLPADLTGDGLLDFVLVETGFQGFPGRIDTWVANGVGGYTVHIGALLQGGTSSAGVGDVNGDGRPDVIASNSTAGSLSVLAGLGDGTFAAPVSFSVGGSPGQLLLRDLDGDDLLDIVLVDPSLGRVLVLTGLGGGHFTALQSVPVPGQPSWLSAGRLDGDGALDLLVSAGGNGELALLRGVGDGTFTVVATVSHVPLTVGSALGDFDEDGVLDAAVGTQSPPALRATDAIAVLRNHTYAAGSPFTDLGQAFPGANGYAIQLADGTLAAGTPVSFKLLNALPGGHSTVFLGFSQANLPFKGGTLVPFPDLVYTPFPISGAGATTLSATWPGSVPTGFAFYLQFGFKDVGALNGYAVSNAVRVVTP